MKAVAKGGQFHHDAAFFKANKNAKSLVPSKYSLAETSGLERRGQGGVEHDRHRPGRLTSDRAGSRPAHRRPRRPGRSPTMTRPNRFATWLLALVFPTSLPGCLDEVEDPDKPLAISGTVTYKGAPVKQGMIQSMPDAAGGLPATGTVVDGVIRDVTTRTRGDGVKAGNIPHRRQGLRRGVPQDRGERDLQRPRPRRCGPRCQVPQLAHPRPRYASIRESGLVAEFSPTQKEIRIDLVE